MVLISSDVLLKDISTNLIILDDTGDTELLDTITDGNELRCTPKETVHADLSDELLELSHVSGVIPWFNVEDNRGFGNDGMLTPSAFKKV